MSLKRSNALYLQEHTPHLGPRIPTVLSKEARVDMNIAEGLIDRLLTISSEIIAPTGVTSKVLMTLAGHFWLGGLKQ